MDGNVRVVPTMISLMLGELTDEHSEGMREVEIEYKNAYERVNYQVRK